MMRRHALHFVWFATSTLAAFCGIHEVRAQYSSGAQGSAPMRLNQPASQPDYGPGQLQQTRQASPARESVYPSATNPGPNYGQQPVRVAQQFSPPGQPRSTYAPADAPNAAPPSGVVPAGQFVPVNQQNQPQSLPAGPVQVQQHVPQRARFQLSPEETQQLHRVLHAWEVESEKVKNFACPFERWEYDEVFGPGKNIPKIIGYGDLKYIKPDKGHFHIKKLTHYTPSTKPDGPPTYVERDGEFGEHWVCDGKAVYEYKFKAKQLVVYELPEEMRGKAIADGPLPFLFGAKKDKLLQRYDMRVTNETADEVWLDAWPLRQGDAANFQHVELILSNEQMLPKAMMVHMPNGKTRMVYIFKGASVNSTLGTILDWFEQPRTPLGWKKVIEKAPAPDPQRQAGQPQLPPR